MGRRTSATGLLSPPTHATRTRRPLDASWDGKQFERFIEDLSASFVRAPAPDIGREIDRWIKEIVLGLNLDRGALSQIDPESGKLVVRHSWSRDHIIRLPVGLELARPAPWFDSLLMKGRTLVFSKVRELPQEFRDSDWITFRRFVPKSNVSVPLRIAGEVVGSIGWATLKRERIWTPRLVRRLELVSQIFGNALERRRAAEENTLLRDELNHLSRATVMGELSASITHQLNHPIAAILSNAEAIESILQSAPPDLEEVRTATKEIIQDSLRATETIKGLRAFFHKGTLESVPLDVTDVVREVVRIVRSDALFRNISLKFEAPSSEPYVTGDRVQLQHAILNLVLNAFDAVSEVVGEREVSTSIVVDGDQVKVTVSDTGVGIHPASISHLFEPFYTTKPRGMGMGLAVARSIVKAHGGQLSARRNPDRGSTFEIVLRALEDGVA